MCLGGQAGPAATGSMPLVRSHGVRPPTKEEALSGGLHGKVVEVLGAEISAGQHPPGTVLRIDELEQRFGISRSVAREVVRTLASIRLVVGRKRVGVVVRPREEWNTFDPALIRWLLAADWVGQVKTLVELRTAVEPPAQALSTLTISMRATPRSFMIVWLVTIASKTRDEKTVCRSRGLRPASRIASTAA